jgi:aromatic-L-amino-acid decarboxylase
MKELDADEFRRLGHIAVELAAEHMFGMRDRPVYSPMSGAERSVLMQASLPESGMPPTRILELVRTRIMSHPMGNGHPRFFGWANSPPSSMGVLSEMLAAAVNPNCAGGDHAAIYVEHCALRWLMDLVGFPTEQSQGVLVSGGSMASLTCLAAARHRALAQVDWDVRKRGLVGAPQLVMYVSDQGHSCIHKAAELLGIGGDNVRVIPSDAAYRLEIEALVEALAADRAQGLTPFCVCASAGTANTGAIDPLAELSELCEREGLWFHVDGAIGAIAALDTSLEALSALALADSVALDPHKWMGIPVECGAALLRDGQLLRDSFSLVPAYLRTEPGRGFGGLPWFSEYGFQQTRGFRALKLWTTLLHLGREGLRRRVEQHRALARALAARIAQEPLLELLAEPELAIVCFRYTGLAEPGEKLLNAFNRALVAQLQTEGEVFLTGTELKHCYALRVSIMHHATRATDLALLLQLVMNTAARLQEADFSVGMM